MPQRPPTIYDVARMLGVSPSTVSRGLNHPGRLSSATEARVRAGVRDLGFHANPMARGLPTGRTMTLALLVADITNPVVFGMIRGAERAAAAGGHTLLIAESQESATSELATLHRVLRGVDGIVLATTRLAGRQISTLAASKPFVLINRALPGVRGVVPELDGGIGQLLAHLDKLGHRRLCYVGGPARSWVDRRRLTVLRRHAGRRDIEVITVPRVPPTVAGGAQAWAHALRSGASAIIAFNDLMAMGMLRSAASDGVAVPGQVSICGFDDIFGADLTSPALTTVRAPLDVAGQRAVRLLLAQLDGEQPEAQDTQPFPTELVVRGSTGPAKAGSG